MRPTLVPFFAIALTVVLLVLAAALSRPDRTPPQEVTVISPEVMPLRQRP